MGNFRFHIPSIFFTLFLLLSPVFVFSLDTDGLELTGGMLLLLNADEASAPSPVENSLGMHLPLHFSRHFGMKIGLDAYAVRYQIRDGEIYPADVEFRDYTTTGTVAFSLPLHFRFPVSPEVTAGFGLGPLFLVRFPLKSWGSMDEEAVMDLLYRDTRFLYSEFLMDMNWKFSRTQALTLTGRFQYPLHVLWNADAPDSWYDRIMIQVQIGLRFLFGAGLQSESGT